MIQALRSSCTKMPSNKQLFEGLLLDGNIDGICAALSKPEFAVFADNAAVTACSMFVLRDQSETPWCRVLEAALGAGAKVVNGTDADRSLLSLASRHGALDRMRILLAHGDSPRNVARALMHAVEYGQSEAVALLLEHRADVHAKDGKGQTVLFWAVREADERMIDLLVSSGADMHAVDQSGQTLLHEALFLGLGRGGKSNPQQCLQDASRICVHLVRLGVSAERCNEEGRSALEQSALYSPELQKVLHEAWANRQSIDLDKETPLSIGQSDQRRL